MDPRAFTAIYHADAYYFGDVFDKHRHCEMEASLVPADYNTTLYWLHAETHDGYDYNFKMPPFAPRRIEEKMNRMLLSLYTDDNVSKHILPQKQR